MRLIDADKLFEVLNKKGVPFNANVNEAILTAPTVEERKKGKWIEGKCNHCGEHAPYWCMASTYYRSNFCPNCGADMRGESEVEG